MTRDDQIKELRDEIRTLRADRAQQSIIDSLQRQAARLREVNDATATH